MSGKHHVLYPELIVSDAPEFLDHLETLIPESADWRRLPLASDCRAVHAEYVGNEFDGTGLSLSACEYRYHDDDSAARTVIFATLATRWGKEPRGFPAATIPQVIAAFNLFRPLVHATARTLGIRVHLRLPKEKRIRPLSAVTAKRLDAFCVLANTSVLHPYDWERFYSFVRFCHAHSVHLGSGRVAIELGKRGFPEHLARMLAERYGFGRSLLKGDDDWQDGE